MTAASMIDAGVEPPVSDDSGAGLAMFLIFTAAVLIVSGAVAIVALVGTWWALAAGFAAHIVLTTVVILTIYRVMSGRATAGPPAPARGQAARAARS